MFLRISKSAYFRTRTLQNDTNKLSAKISLLCLTSLQCFIQIGATVQELRYLSVNYLIIMMSYTDEYQIESFD